MESEVWFRNPHNYVKELVETGECNIAWDRGTLVKTKIDPAKHAALFFGNSYPWRILAIGEQGAAEIRDGFTLEKPLAVYPVWEYGDEPAILEELLEYPVGMDSEICSDLSVPRDERPVFGQDHRVVITNIPVASSGPGRSFLRLVSELQEQYPQAIIHLHGLYSYRAAFGMKIRSADIDPRSAAQKGKVTLGSGKNVPFERAQSNVKWITNLGFKPKDLEAPRVRCMFNIKSAVWAAKNFHMLSPTTLPMTSSKPVDHESSDNEHVPPRGLALARGAVAETGDKFLCDSCSLADSCSYYREGSVCTLPGAEVNSLVQMFQSRDSGKIIDGLGAIVGRNVERMEKGVAMEELDGEMDPNVTRLMGQVFDQGVKLAKLVNPELNGGPKVQVNVGNGAAAVTVSSPTQLFNAAVAELQSEGYAPEDITEELLEKKMNALTGQGETIKGELG